jgi:hypothetical protein
MKKPNEPAETNPIEKECEYLLDGLCFNPEKTKTGVFAIRCEGCKAETK